MTRTEGPVPRPKNASISRTWWTGRLLTRPGASLLGALSDVSPATSRSGSHSLCSDRSDASPAAKPTRPLTPHSSLSGKRRAPSSSPRSSTTPWARSGSSASSNRSHAHTNARGSSATRLQCPRCGQGFKVPRRIIAPGKANSFCADARRYRPVAFGWWQLSGSETRRLRSVRSSSGFCSSRC